MKTPRLFLIVAAFAAVAALIAYWASPKSTAEKSASRADVADGRMVSAPAEQAAPASQISTAPLPSTNSSAGGAGHDGDHTSAPDRPAGALVAAPATRPALAPGAKATAWATVGGTTTPELAPNQFGELPRVDLPLGGKATVRMHWQEAKPGDRIVAAVEDGGTLADGKHVMPLVVNERGEIEFPFEASKAPGLFRVSVRHGSDQKIIQFWAGDVPVAQR